MNPTLHKLYHRRGKYLEAIAEIDKEIAELTPQRGDFVVYDDGTHFIEGIYNGSNEVKGWYKFRALSSPELRSYLTILEKGFER